MWKELTFSNTVTSQDISVSISDDTIEEGEESFRIVVSSNDSKCVPGRSATVIIAMSGEHLRSISYNCIHAHLS